MPDEPSSPPIDAQLLRALPQLQRRLLEVAAVSMVELTWTQLNTALRKFGCRDPAGKTLKNATLYPVAEALAGRGLLDPQGDTCPPPVRDAVTRLLLQDGSYSRVAEVVSAACPLVRESNRGGEPRWKDRGVDHFAREIRISLLAQDWDRAVELGDAARSVYGDRSAPLARAALRPLEADWLDRLPGQIARPLLEELLDGACRRLSPISDLVPPAKKRLEEQDHPGLRLVLGQSLVLAGCFVEAEQLLAGDPSAASRSVTALLRANEGDYERACEGWEEALRLRRKETRKRKAYLEDLGAPFFPLALIALGSLDRAAEVARAAERWDGRGSGAADEALQAVRVRQGSEGWWSRRDFDEERVEPWVDLARLLAQLAGDSPPRYRTHARALELAGRARAAGFSWIARELFTGCGQEGGESAAGAPWSAALAPIPRWRRRLDALLALAPTEPAPEAAASPSTGATERLAWFLEERHGSYCVQPKLQKRSKRGWSKGRNVALKRLHGDPEDPELLSVHDRRVLAHLGHEVYYSQGYPNDSYSFVYPDVLLALADHPLLFDGTSGAPATVVRVEPSARLISEDGTTAILIEPRLEAGRQALERTGEGRFRLVVFTEPQRALAKVIGDGLSVPTELGADLAAATALLSDAFPLAASGLLATAAVVEIPADSGVRVLLEREGEGLAVQLRVRPLAGGPAFRPGHGGTSVRHKRGGEPVQALRDLGAERDGVRALLERCPALVLGGDLLRDDGLLADPLDALRLFSQLQSSLEPDRIEWPAGRPWTLQEIGDEALQLQVGQVQGWFEASGRLSVDEELVLDLRSLLRMLRRRRGRFVPLGADRFAALSEEMVRQLDRLDGLAVQHEGDGARFHPLAVPALVEAVQSLGASTDAAWRARVRALTPIEAELTVPVTLQADLRPYQLDGFRWLCTLASWGAGACLADEMGLGKTVQALALLAARAQRGPALVVAPTSVVPGWRREAARFVPSLRVCVLGGQDRSAQLAALGPRDLLLCSYGLLVSERASLQATRFSTVVLDEAQGIKNPETARAQAAFALQAEARVVLTGTPVENRLLDLWSIFRFLNPGLLGAQSEFRARFAGPIERDSDPRARSALNALVRPFVLRRSKTAVLPELPARTEHVLPVELGEGEASLYEAIRREALLELHEGVDVLTVLSWLTKLRLACCHPALAGGAELPSSKTAAFLELVESLADGGHRALVFSQFVRHLALVREALEERGIRYQYLDGSMSVPARQEAVERFEAGEGELFLISLRAGGTGLNLTSADNVIHLDPWWNPAVEDQASDRVHRIGQRRPVTVHRLVAQGTVEEDIVALHHRKRALADSILAGTDSAARLSVTQLVALIGAGASSRGV